MVDFPSWGHAWATARFSLDPACMLLTVTHPEMETIRLARYPEDIVSRSQTFKASWFEPEWVNDDGQIPRCTLSFPNIDRREIGQRYLKKPTAPEVTLEVIAISAPDEPIKAVYGLELRGITIDPVSITGDLMGRDHSSEPVGKIIVIPSRFPALYRRVRKT